MKIKVILLCVIVPALLLSCSPQKRLQRLIKRHPELVQVDTIRVNLDTVLPGQSFIFPDVDVLGSTPRDDNFYWPDNDSLILKDSTVIIYVVKKRKLNPADITGETFVPVLDITGHTWPRPVNLTDSIPTPKIKEVKETNIQIMVKWIAIALACLAAFIITALIVKKA